MTRRAWNSTLPLPEKPLSRGAGPTRKGPIQKVNRKRRTDAFDRAFGGAERVIWMHNQRSVVSGEWECVTAHVRTGGMGRRADSRWTVPLTPVEHEELHRIGQRSFEAKYGIDLLAAAAEMEKRWQAHASRTGD